jgi:hypothetical protein
MPKATMILIIPMIAHPTRAKRMMKKPKTQGQMKAETSVNVGPGFPEYIVLFLEVRPTLFYLYCMKVSYGASSL